MMMMMAMTVMMMVVMMMMLMIMMMMMIMMMTKIMTMMMMSMMMMMVMMITMIMTMMIMTMAVMMMITIIMMMMLTLMMMMMMTMMMMMMNGELELQQFLVFFCCKLYTQTISSAFIYRGSLKSETNYKRRRGLHQCLFNRGSVSVEHMFLKETVFLNENCQKDLSSFQTEVQHSTFLQISLNLLSPH